MPILQAHNNSPKIELMNKKLKHTLRWVGILMVIFCMAYLLGPRPDAPVFSKAMPEISAEGSSLERWLARREASFKLRPDNEARIVWASDSLKQPTEYAIVYLHGFSASQEEGDPVHTTLARRFGANLYLSRLSMHGMDTTEQLLGLTADSYWESAKEALAIGKKLGQKVILVGTSTGGTQALQLAAAFPNEVYALMLLSPNIAINDPNAWLLNNPWGMQIARMVIGDKYIVAKDTRPIYRQYWSSPYRIEAAVELQEMLEQTMKASTFKKITQPLLLMYYYKDKDHQDDVVRVDAMLDMFEQIQTPHSLKVKQPMPEAGDHVIGSHLKSKQIEGVISAATNYMQQVLNMPVVNP
jgi:pimeloyl-ACP methyl ester carboxylesterase